MNTINQTAQQRRIKTAVKRLVIALGYLEICLDEGLLDVNIHAAAVGLDGAIDRLNDYLAGGEAAEQAA